MAPLLYLVGVLGTWTLFPVVTSESVVSKLAENLRQAVTSTTLQWVPYNGDSNVLEYAVEGGQQNVEDANGNVVARPVHICRAKLGVWVSGQLRPNTSVCVVSLYSKVQESSHFEVLVNIENSGRLSWIKKDRYNYIQQGAVSTGDNSQAFVARAPSRNAGGKNSASHILGTFNAEENFGMFHLIDENNVEVKVEDGEILMETEPVRYEFKNIKYNKLRSRFPKKKVILGKAVLKNTGDTLSQVETIIAYNYSYSLNWGKGHGFITGLPYQIFLTNGSIIEGTWGVSQPEQTLFVTVPVERHLQPGTGVNVTLVGNYTESEVPYRATVVAIYKDNEKRETTIEDIKRENTMLDVVKIFDQEYFLYNNSFIPTTTTTTTTTTTSTTTSKTTSTTVTPIAPPPEENMIKEDKKGLYSSDKKHENNSMMSDDSEALTSKKKEENGANSSSSIIFNLTYLLTLLLTTRIT